MEPQGAPEAQDRATEWVAHIDESGRDGEDGHLVLACVMTRREDLARLAGGICELKRRLAPARDPCAWELHAREIMRGPGSRGTPGPLRPRTPAEGIAILGSVIDTVCGAGVTILCVTVRKRRGAIGLAATLLLERVELFLRSRGEGQTARIVSDEMIDCDRQAVDRAVADSMRGRNPRSLVRTERITRIEHVNSADSELVQAADVVAYVANRHVAGDAAMGDIFRRIDGKIWHGGELDGWKALK